VPCGVELSRARIVELTSGTADLHVTFSTGELILGEARRHVDPCIAVELGDGWELLPEG